MYFVAYCADNMENDSLTQVGSSEKLCIYHSSKVIQLPNFSLQRDKKNVFSLSLKTNVEELCRPFYFNIALETNM